MINIIILSGTNDPTSTATSADLGTLYLNTNTLNMYLKQDSGSSTNWILLGSPSHDYIPADSTKWANPNPTTLDNAIDRIAAVVGASTPIP